MQVARRLVHGGSSLARTTAHRTTNLLVSPSLRFPSRITPSFLQFRRLSDRIDPRDSPPGITEDWRGGGWGTPGGLEKTLRFGVWGLLGLGLVMGIGLENDDDFPGLDGPSTESLSFKLPAPTLSIEHDTDEPPEGSVPVSLTPEEVKDYRDYQARTIQEAQEIAFQYLVEDSVYSEINDQYENWARWQNLLERVRGPPLPSEKSDRRYPPAWLERKMHAARNPRLSDRKPLPRFKPVSSTHWRMPKEGESAHGSSHH